MRRRHRRIAIGVGITLVALVALGVAAWLFRVQLLELVPTPPVVISDADNGRTVSILEGQTLEVHLRSNRYTGSTWHLGIPVTYLEPTGQMTFIEDQNPAKPGDGYQTLSFRVTGTGTGPLFLDYLSDADQGSYQPSKSFRVVVDAR